MPNRTTARAGWTRVRFGDVVRLSTERCTDPVTAGIDRYVGLEHLEPSDLRIRSWGNVADGVTFTNRFRRGQVLFGKRRAYQRKVAVAEFDGICSSDIYVFEPADDRLLPELLPFICQTDGFFEHALKTSAGSLSPRTNWTRLADYEFGLPTAGEQKRTLRLLGVIDRTIENLAECARRGKALIARLQERFVPPEIQAGIPLSKLCASERGVTTGPFGSLLHQYDYCADSDGVPVVMPADMTDGRINHMTVAKVSRRKAAEMEAYALMPGDILVPRRGELDRRALVSQTDCPALCGTGSIRIRPAYSADSMRIFFALSTVATVRYLMNNSQGSIMPSIGAKTVAAIPLAAMSQESRDTYVARCQAVMAALDRLHNRTTSLCRLRVNAMTQAFLSEA